MVGSIKWRPLNFTLLFMFNCTCLGQILSPVPCPCPCDKQGVSDLVFTRQLYHQKTCFHSEWDLLLSGYVIPCSPQFKRNDHDDGPVRICKHAWPSLLCILAVGSYQRLLCLFDACNISQSLSRVYHWLKASCPVHVQFLFHFFLLGVTPWHIQSHNWFAQSWIWGQASPSLLPRTSVWTYSAFSNEVWWYMHRCVYIHVSMCMYTYVIW